MSVTSEKDSVRPGRYLLACMAAFIAGQWPSSARRLPRRFEKLGRIEAGQRSRRVHSRIGKLKLFDVVPTEQTARHSLKPAPDSGMQMFLKTGGHGKLEKGLPALKAQI
jgi:hypothetical protein